MKNIPEEFWITIGVAMIILALGAGVIGITYAGNVYGNQVAKKCIAQGGAWRLADNRNYLYECRNSKNGN